MWIFFLLFTVSDGRRYDKCITKDGRQGVCAIKRYCREGSHHELLPCDRDGESHCCPISTTQRSVSTLPPIPERAREEDRYAPEPEVKRKRPEVFGQPERDDRLNKTPPPADRKPPARHNNDRPKEGSNRDRTDGYDDDRRNPYEPPENPRDRPERPRPPASFNNDRPKDRPNSDRTDEYDDDRRNPYKPPGNSRDPPERQRPPRRPNSDGPKKRPGNGNRDDDDVRLSYEPEGDTRDRPDRPRLNSHGRPSARPTDYDQRDRPSRPSDRDRYYPAKDDLDSPNPSRIVNYGKRPEVEKDDAKPPRRVYHDRVPERKNLTTEPPIRFPPTDEISLPRPKVPACGVKPYDLFIAGGQESAEHEWPWMTAIFRRFPDSRPKTFVCGGSLINTKYVLTAAHCFVNNYVILPASSFVVRLGSHFLDSGEEYTVSNLVIHDNHSSSDYFNDIALVRLASEVYITDKIAPICLPYPEMIQDDFVGRLATVAGWGDTVFRSSGTRILQHVTVPVVSGDDCLAAYSRVSGLAFLARGSDHIICAGLKEGGKDACLGDSGGPLMIRMPDDRWIIIGIVSLGFKCAEPGYPGVYTRVTHYISWINTNMKRH